MGDCKIRKWLIQVLGTRLKICLAQFIEVLVIALYIYELCLDNVTKLLALIKSAESVAFSQARASNKVKLLFQPYLLCSQFGF